MGWTCLIVDDESDTCWAIEHVLGRCAIRCTRALTAAAALGQMQPGAFDLAILDVKLPDLDGIELALLVVSGYFYRHDATIEQAQAEGLILDFIAKPFQHQELTRAVERALAR
jgi:DNA-binding NtrC family response regulator